ncbi:fungal hydrophobin [Marasmius fiardii PR-910]|nr:fungal hydrophobin [Marasmius fiardii PR-910]
MLFNKLVTLSAITTLAAATALPRGGGGDGSGPQCCKQVQTVDQANASGIGGLLTLIGVAVGDITALVGLNCSPITVIGGGNGACNTNTVNCQGSAFGGLINIGCVPIQI